MVLYIDIQLILLQKFDNIFRPDLKLMELAAWKDGDSDS